MFWMAIRSQLCSVVPSAGWDPPNLAQRMAEVDSIVQDPYYAKVKLEGTMEETYRVVEAHQSSFPDPLVLEAGAQLRFERKDTEWEGWLWCTDAQGNGGWVPEAWLSLDEGVCTLQQHYTARELSVAPGGLVTAERVESGWVFGSTAQGEQGWVPLKCLSPIDGIPPYPLTDAEQAKMLGKLMLFWDGQWFLKAVEEFGLDAAIELNARVRTSFGRIEMRTLLKAVGKSRADDLPDAMRLLETYAQVFLGDRLRAEFAVMSDEQAQVVVSRCAAYEGAKLAGLSRVDQACIACETLWDAWLETLLPDDEWNVQYPTRQGKGDAVCRFMITIRAS